MRCRAASSSRSASCAAGQSRHRSFASAGCGVRPLRHSLRMHRASPLIETTTFRRHFCGTAVDGVQRRPPTLYRPPPISLGRSRSSSAGGCCRSSSASHRSRRACSWSWPPGIRSMCRCAGSGGTWHRPCSRPCRRRCATKRRRRCGHMMRAARSRSNRTADGESPAALRRLEKCQDLTHESWIAVSAQVAASRVHDQLRVRHAL